MKQKSTIITTIGIIGLIAMFFFPSPEENFIYYLGLIILIIGLIVCVSKRKS